MSITTLDGYVASQKDNIEWMKSASRTTVANIWFSVFELAGQPGAGTLAGTSTTAGVVPTDATAGCPLIDSFAGGASGYLTRVDFSNTVACRIQLYDMLFKAGAYAFNASQTLSAQPSFVARCPDYVGGAVAGKGNEIWIETVTAFTGNQSIAVTYTNESGTTGRTTGTIATGVAPTLGRMLQLPLQAGDSGVQKIESVVSTVSTVGTFNVLVLRPLWSGRVPLAGFSDVHALDKTGMPRVYADSAIIALVRADSTSSGIPDLTLQIASA